MFCTVLETLREVSLIAAMFDEDTEVQTQQRSTDIFLRLICSQSLCLVSVLWSADCATTKLENLSQVHYKSLFYVL